MDSPHALLCRLDEHLATVPPSAGRTYAGAVRALVVAVDEAGGAFTDPRMPLATTAYLVRRYLAAETARTRSRPDDVPLPWRTALTVDAARPPLRQLLVTANAALNDDLPRALLALPGGDDGGARADHRRWTDLMAAVFADVACPADAGPVGRVAALRERPLIRQALAAAGAQAWRNAEDLRRHRAAPDRPGGTDGFDDRSRLLATLTVGQVGELLTRQRWPAPRWSDVLVVRLPSP